MVSMRSILVWSLLCAPLLLIYCLPAQFSTLPADCDLQQLHIHVLGLGDRRYPHFCQFAKQLQTRLIAQGAQTSLPLMTVDNMQATDIAQWQAQTAK